MNRSELAREALDGLSVGDALGAQFFVPGRRVEDLYGGRIPPPWQWTDDTEMAGSVVAELERSGDVDRDALVAAFAGRCEPYRGYGPGAVAMLHQVRDGRPWRDAAAAMYGGQGSCGNGAAMRVAPLGAWFHDDLDLVVSRAVASAEVTHQHPEGVAGAVAVAVAAAVAVQARLAGARPSPATFLGRVRSRVPSGTVARGVERAGMLLGASPATAAYHLGNGAQAIAQDTVPLTMWVVARHLHDFGSAIVACLDAGGDVDTTGAIVGGIVAAFTGRAGIPPAWLAAREPLPPWLG